MHRLSPLAFVLVLFCSLGMSSSGGCSGSGRDEELARRAQQYGSSWGDYAISGTVVVEYSAYSADGTPQGRHAFTEIDGPRITLLDEFDRVKREVTVDDGKYRHEFDRGGRLRAVFGSQSTDLVDIWDDNPTHRFAPFVIKPSGGIKTVPNPSTTTSAIRFDTGGFFWIKVWIVGDPGYGSPAEFSIELFNDQIDAGSHEILWDGTMPDGSSAPRGAYRARVWVSSFGWLWDDMVVRQ